MHRPGLFMLISHGRLSEIDNRIISHVCIVEDEGLEEGSVREEGVEKCVRAPGATCEVEIEEGVEPTEERGVEHGMEVVDDGVTVDVETPSEIEREEGEL